MTTTDVPVIPAPRAQVALPAVRSFSWPVVALVASLAVGVTFRLLAFSSDRPLWIDEAMIALNVTDRDVGQLFEPLDRHQSAPVAFLLAGKLCVAVFGPTEHALRLPALVGSLVGLAAFTVAAVRLLPPWTARLAVLLFAVSPTLVSYAAEVKQYSTDAAVAAGLLALSIPLLRTPTRGRLIALAIGGTAAVWASHPAVFVLAAVGVVIFVRSLLRKEHCVAVLLVGAAWVVSFAAVYQVNVRFGAGDGFLADFWADQFPPLSLSAGPWVVEHVTEFFATAGGFGGPMLNASGLAIALAVIGAVAMRKERRAELAVLLGVFAAVLLASALHKYPFIGRLLLFLVPGGMLLVASGTGAVVGAVWRRSKVGAVVIAVAVVFAPTAEAIRQFRHPDRDEDMPVALRFVKEHWQPGDRLYVYNGSTDLGAGPAFAFYSRRDPFPPDAVTLGGSHRADARGYRAEVNELAVCPGRVWVLFSHQHADEEATIRAYFDGVADRGEQFRDPATGRGPSAAAVLYTIR